MKTNDRLYIDFHVLQTVPPSCVNRDDTGSPKTATFGGTTRARVSSQAWKRAVRARFTEMLGTEKVGSHTLCLPDILAKRIAEIDSSVDAEKLALKTLKAAKLKIKKETSKDEMDAETTIYQTDTLLFISPAQVDALAALALESVEGKEVLDKAHKEALNKVLNEAPTLDIVLFGRMVASNPALKIDACCQVAHAISTHTVQGEYDYFTAVDDYTKRTEYLDTMEFNSSTLYRYATINAQDLASKLGAQAPRAIRAFAEAFLYTMPTGRQNPFANRTIPDYVYVTIRTDQSVNLSGAFERPVPPSEDGYVARSVQRLEQYAKRVYENFLPAPEAAYCTSMVDGAESFATRLPRNELLNVLEREAAVRLGAKE